MPFPNLEGRPSSYREEVIGKVSDFANKQLKLGNLPTRAGLANYIGITKDTLIRWGNDHKQLFDALMAFDQLQEDEIWQKALRGEYNSNIAKLLLYNHGYSDKSEIKQDLNVKSDISDEELDELIKQKANKVGVS